MRVSQGYLSFQKYTDSNRFNDYEKKKLSDNGGAHGYVFANIRT